MTRVWPQIEAAEQALLKDAQAQKAGLMSEAQVVAALDQRHIPAYLGIVQALMVLDLPPGDPQRANLLDLKLLFSLHTDIMQLQVRKARDALDHVATDQKLTKLVAQLQAISQRIKERRAPNAQAKNNTP